MNALAQLMDIAGDDASSAFAGNCVDCGRGTYRQGDGEIGRSRGWILKATSYKCMTCYQRQRKAEISAVLMEVPDPTPREVLMAEAVRLRKAGQSVRSIGLQIGRSERAVAQMLSEALGPTLARRQDGVKDCVGCGVKMRYRGERQSVGTVVKHGRGRCAPCYMRAKRRGEFR